MGCVEPSAAGFLTIDDLTRLYREHARAIVAFFARRTADPEAAVDLTAETFATAIAERASCRARDDEQRLAWVYGIARHQLTAWYRRGAIERRGLRRLGAERRALTDDELERIVELAGLEETRAAVAAALPQLPAEQQEAVRLRVVEQLDYATIATRLGIRETTVRARVSRGRRSRSAP